MRRIRLRLGAVLLLTAALVPFHRARSNPDGAAVTHGSATIQQTGNALTITQGTEQAIIHWQNFSIAPGELTRFIQPGIDSTALNRVLSANPSSILGSLQSNGKLILINPNGILVGPGGRIDTGGFTASTLEISDADFLNGGDLDFSGDSQEGVTNLGSIATHYGGDIFLIGRRINNEGTLDAPGGTVGLAAGQQVLIKAAGQERVFIETEVDATLDDKGLIAAATAELKSAGGSPEALAVNVSGIVEATGVENRGGQIYLSAGGGSASVSGTLKARKSSGAGGRVQVTAKNITVESEAIVDASGTTAGGEILIGGDYQGNNPDIPNADNTLIKTGASLNADALAYGDGGRIIVWADGDTYFAGDLSAAARGEFGDGGFAEVSGKENLAFYGRVDLTSNSGELGTLLLDPDKVFVRNGLTQPNDVEIGDGQILNSDGGAVTYNLSEFAVETAALSSFLNIGANWEITIDPLSDSVLSLPNGATFSAGGDFWNNGNTIDTDGGSLNIFSGNQLWAGSINTSASSPGANGGNVFLSGLNGVWATNIWTNGAGNSLGNGGNAGNVDLNSSMGGVQASSIQQNGGFGCFGGAAGFFQFFYYPGAFLSIGSHQTNPGQSIKFGPSFLTSQTRLSQLDLIIQDRLRALDNFEQDHYNEFRSIPLDRDYLIYRGVTTALAGSSLLAFMGSSYDMGYGSSYPGLLGSSYVSPAASSFYGLLGSSYLERRRGSYPWGIPLEDPLPSEVQVTERPFLGIFGNGSSYYGPGGSSYVWEDRVPQRLGEYDPDPVGSSFVGPGGSFYIGPGGSSYYPWQLDAEERYEYRERLTTRVDEKEERFGAGLGYAYEDTPNLRIGGKYRWREHNNARTYRRIEPDIRLGAAYERDDFDGYDSRGRRRIRSTLDDQYDSRGRWPLRSTRKDIYEDYGPDDSSMLWADGSSKIFPGGSSLAHEGGSKLLLPGSGAFAVDERGRSMWVGENGSSYVDDDGSEKFERSPVDIGVRDEQLRPPRPLDVFYGATALAIVEAALRQNGKTWDASVVDKADYAHDLNRNQTVIIEPMPLYGTVLVGFFSRDAEDFYTPQRLLIYPEDDVRRFHLLGPSFSRGGKPIPRLRPGLRDEFGEREYLD